MKRFLLVSFLVMFVFGAYAQVEKGKFLLGGATGFSFSSQTNSYQYESSLLNEEHKEQTIELTPRIGYFVIDNLAVGLQGEIASQKTKSGSDDWGDPTNTTGLSLFGRYYLGGSAVKGFGQANLGFAAHSFGEEDWQKYSGLTYGGRLGVAYFLNPKLSLDLSVGYNAGKFSSKEDFNPEIENSQVDFGIGISFSF